MGVAQGHREFSKCYMSHRMTHNHINHNTHVNPYNDLLGIFFFLEERLTRAVCACSQDLRLWVFRGTLGVPFADAGMVTLNLQGGSEDFFCTSKWSSTSLCTQAGELIELSLLV